MSLLTASVMYPLPQYFRARTSPEFPLVAVDSGVDHAEELAVLFAHQCPMIGIALLPHRQAGPTNARVSSTSP